VRMIWWFLILAASAGAVLWASIAAYLRVRRHMTIPNAPGRTIAEPGVENKVDVGE